MLAESDPTTPDPSTPEPPWQRAAQQARTLQRIQVISLVVIGLAVVLGTLGAGLLFLTSFKEQEARERERAQLVSIRDRVRGVQVEVLRKLSEGEAPFTAEAVPQMISLATKVMELASRPTSGEREEGREARQDVIRLVGEFSSRLAAAPNRDAFGESLTNADGQRLFDEYFQTFETWVQVHGAGLEAERRRQREIVVSSGLTVSMLVLVLAIVALLVWWRAERARERIVGGARQQSRRFDSLASNATDIVLVVNESGTADYCSPSVSRLLGWSPAEVQGRPLRGLVHPDDGPKLRVLSEDQIAASEVSDPVDLRLLHRDGSWVFVEALVRNLLDDEAIDGFVFSCRDIRDRKKVEAQLAHQAFHDPLTGLPNRALFRDRLAHALDRQSSTCTPVAVMVLDLDDFKTVNDSLGHDVGDELLNVTGQRIQRTIRPGDTAARLGGDEYAVVLEDIAGPVAARHIAERIVKAIREPVTLAGREVAMSASIGIATAPRDGDSTEILVRHADIAMYEAKSRRGIQALTFEPEMEARIEDRMSLSLDLNRAVDAGDQFRLVYQPIVELQTQRIIGLEALLRWDHPEKGEIPPLAFMTLAEETGAIGPIGEIVLHTACKVGTEWNLRTPPGERVLISVNVSPRQLEDPGFVDAVSRALTASALPPESLVLEVTESAVMRDVSQAAELLSAIKRLGVRLAIDDFGTGYSSLSQLGRLPVDLVKIDKVFVDRLVDGTADADFTGVIVQLGAVLGLQTVAEGIEVVEQVDALQLLGCQFGQGYLFGRPTSPVEVSRLLADQDGGRLSNAPSSARDEGTGKAAEREAWLSTPGRSARDQARPGE
jgi:diguanylate cyclase (GGDEF)-like protein/PAS domain S-box-containing protein